MQFWSRGRIFRSEAGRAFLKSNRCGSEVGRDDGEVRAGTDEGTMSTSLRPFLAGIGGHENMPTRGALKMGGALHGVDLGAQGLEALGERWVGITQEDVERMRGWMGEVIL